MSNTHPVTIVVFVLLLALALWSQFTAKPKLPTVSDADKRALRRRTDPVWKDRGTL